MLETIVVAAVVAGAAALAARALWKELSGDEECSCGGCPGGRKCGAPPGKGEEAGKCLDARGGQ